MRVQEGEHREPPVPHVHECAAVLHRLCSSHERVGTRYSPIACSGARLAMHTHQAVRTRVVVCCHLCMRVAACAHALQCVSASTHV